MSLAQEELFAEESLAGRGDSGDTRGVGTARTHRVWGQRGHTEPAPKGTAGLGDSRDTQGMGTAGTHRVWGHRKL